MNIQVVPGSSCSVYQIAGYGPHLARHKLREFWKSYLQGGDLAYDFQRFVHLTAAGQMLHYEVTGFSGKLYCRFGLEISADERGGYVTIVYLEGIDLEEYVRQAAGVIWNLAARVVPEGGEPRARVKGRRGWPKWLRKQGIYVEKDGIISGWQEYFGYGR